MLFAGIDAGSRSIKVVLLEVNGQGPEILASGVDDSQTNQAQRSRALYERVVKDADRSLDDIEAVVATGYARHLLDFADKAVTEITCHARGVRMLLPDARSIIEIGGQDSKVIHLDESGRVEDFTMNDRCAAGTGCFLEMVAKRLDVDLEELGKLASQSKEPSTISSMCAVFAETEIIGLLSSGHEPSDIAAGVQIAISRRIAGMGGHRLKEPVVFTGGVARVNRMDKMLSDAIEKQIVMPKTPQITGALGAALIAAGAVERVF